MICVARPRNYHSCPPVMDVIGAPQKTLISVLAVDLSCRFTK